MKLLIAWLLGRRPVSPQPSGTATSYRSAVCPPLHPAQVRARNFRLTRFGRRGLDPADVQRFLDRVALDLARAYDTAEQARHETHRIKDALRRWQSEQARTRNQHALFR